MSAPSLLLLAHRCGCCYCCCCPPPPMSGLTHDLGHGPFSHVFEKELLPRLGLGADVVKNW